MHSQSKLQLQWGQNFQFRGDWVLGYLHWIDFSRTKNVQIKAGILNFNLETHISHCNYSYRLSFPDFISKCDWDLEFHWKGIQTPSQNPRFQLWIPQWKWLQHAYNNRRVNTHVIQEKVGSLVETCTIQACKSTALVTQVQNWVLQNKFQLPLFKVWLKCRKSGFGIILQHLLQIFKVHCGNRKGFSTPSINLRALTNVLESFFNTHISHFEMWKDVKAILQQQQKS